jgi:hypothetical protein
LVQSREFLQSAEPNASCGQAYSGICYDRELLAVVGLDELGQEVVQVDLSIVPVQSDECPLAVIRDYIRVDEGEDRRIVRGDLRVSIAYVA